MKVALKTPKNADHVGIVGDTLLCEHCGSRTKMALPMEADLAAGFMKLFTDKHRRCPKREGVSAFRFAESLERWPMSDDTGISSKAIYEHMRFGAARERSAFGNYPHDPSDFGRCYRLLALAPEWRTRMPEMARYSVEWARLAEHWDELTALYEAEVDTSTVPHRAKRKDGCAPRLYERMKAVMAGEANQAVVLLGEQHVTPEKP